MAFDDRIGWLLFGMAVGFIAGYIVRALRELKDDVHEVKEELHEVDEIVKHKLKDEGFMSVRILRDVVVGVVVLVVAWSAFASQKATNEAKNTQDCTVQYLTKTIDALNERTTYAQAQAEANVELQKDQQAFFALLLRKPPEPEARRSAAAQDYLASLNKFLAVSMKSAEKIKNNPYPTQAELKECLS